MGGGGGRKRERGRGRVRVGGGEESYGHDNVNLLHLCNTCRFSFLRWLYTRQQSIRQQLPTTLLHINNIVAGSRPPRLPVQI